MSVEMQSHAWALFLGGLVHWSCKGGSVWLKHMQNLLLMPVHKSGMLSDQAAKA